jgi:hypothetical protein
MLTQFVGPNACDLQLIAPGVAFNKGAGIRMGMEIGADTAGQFDMIHSELVDRRTSRADAVIYGHNYGIVVNGKGERFMDEGEKTLDASFELIAYEVWRNQEQTAFFIADQTMGALNVYAEHPHAFDQSSKDIGRVFAAHSSVAWNSARRDEQFKNALASRDVIGQAKGMIMERYGVGAVQAFELLRKLSQDSNVPLIKVAAELIADSKSAAT